MEQAPSSLCDENLVSHLRVLLDNCNSANNAIQDCAGMDQREVLPIPRVVAIGDQSAGKSSVVSRITRIKLPSSTGICTRTPLHIMARMSKGPAKAVLSVLEHYTIPSGVELLRSRGWQPDTIDGNSVLRKVLHEEGCWPPPLSAVEQAIKDATSAVTEGVLQDGSPPGKSVVDKRLVLEWHSKDTPNMDIIDLPGLVDIPTDKQDPDIHIQIQKIVESYIQDKNTIIVCVFEGFIDVARWKALAVAQKQDPRLERTLLVITKLDSVHPDRQQSQLVEHLDNLKQRYTPLEIVLVKNSSVNETGRQEQGFDDQITEEAKFTREFVPLEAERKQNFHQNFKVGMSALVKRLSGLLVSTYESARPSLIEKLYANISKAEVELREMPQAVTPEKARETVLLLLLRFSQKLNDIYTADHPELLKEDKLAGHHLLYKNLSVVYKTHFGEIIKVPNFMSDEYWDKLNEGNARHTADGLVDHYSSKPQREVYFTAFANGLKKQLIDLAEAAYTVAHSTYKGVIDDIFGKYPSIHHEVHRLMRECILEPQREELKKYMHQTFKAQQDMATTSPIYKAALVFYGDNILGDSVLGDMAAGDDAVLHSGASSTAAGGSSILGQSLDKALAKKYTGALGIEERLLNDALKLLTKHVGASRVLNVRKLRQEQWSLYVYTSIVHNSLRDLLPRVIKLYLATEVIREKVPELLARLEDTNTQLGDRNFLHKAFFDEVAARKRDTKEAEIRALRTALDQLNRIPPFPFKSH